MKCRPYSPNDPRTGGCYIGCDRLPGHWGEICNDLSGFSRELVKIFSLISFYETNFKCDHHRVLFRVVYNRLESHTEQEFYSEYLNGNMLPNTYLEKDLCGLVIQYLKEEGWTEAAQTLEKESLYYFDLEYFRTLFVDGKFDHVMNYLSFLDIQEFKSFFLGILQQKFLAALDVSDKEGASAVLFKEIKPLALDDERGRQIFQDCVSMMELDDFRTHESLVWIENATETRKHIYTQLKTFLQSLPIVKSRSLIPKIPQPGRLRSLINGSLNWQLSLHDLPPHHNTRPRVKTLFCDHNFFSEEFVQFGNYYEEQEFLLRSQPTMHPILQSVGLTPSSDCLIPPPQPTPGARIRSGSTGDIGLLFPAPPYIQPTTPFCLLTTQNTNPSCLGFRPGSSQFAVGSKEGILAFWKMSDPPNLFSSQQLTAPTTKITWSLDGRYLVTLNETQVSVYEATSDSRFTLFQEVLFSFSPVFLTFGFLFDFTSASLLVLFIHQNKAITTYDVGVNRIMWSWEDTTEEVVDMTVVQFRNACLLVTGSIDGLIRIWQFSVAPGPVAIPPPQTSFHTNQKILRVVSAKGSIIVVGDSLDSITQWTVTGQLIRKFQVPSDTGEERMDVGSGSRLDNISVLLKESTLILSALSNIWSWDTNNGEFLHLTQLDREVIHFDISHDGSTMAVITSDHLNQLRLFTKSPQNVPSLPQHKISPYAQPFGVPSQHPLYFENPQSPLFTNNSQKASPVQFPSRIEGLGEDQQILNPSFFISQQNQGTSHFQNRKDILEDIVESRVQQQGPQAPFENQQILNTQSPFFVSSQQTPISHHFNRPPDQLFESSVLEHRKSIPFYPPSNPSTTDPNFFVSQNQNQHTQFRKSQDQGLSEEGANHSSNSPFFVSIQPAPMNTILHFQEPDSLQQQDMSGFMNAQRHMDPTTPALHFPSRRQDDK